MQTDTSAKILKVAFTGGPGGGKSQILPVVASQLRAAFGVNVYVVPESARLLLEGGCVVHNIPPKDPVHFQLSILQVMVALEDNVFALAESTNTWSVLLCDRGVMDAAGFLDPGGW